MMEDEIDDMIPTTSKSPESVSMISPCEIQNIQATIRDLNEEMLASPDERNRTWLLSQSAKWEKKKMFLQYKCNARINQVFRELTGTQLVMMRENIQSSMKRFNELCQEIDEMEQHNELISFNLSVVKHYTSMYRTRAKDFLERSKTVAEDEKEITRIFTNLTDQNHQSFESFEETHRGLSQRAEVIGDLFSKIIEERHQYEVYLKESQELDRSGAELETLNIMLKDNRQTIADLEAEEAILDTQLEDLGKSLEGKLESVKQLPKYLANNEKVIEEWKAKNQTKLAENEEMREKREAECGKTKILINKEIQSKEEVIVESTDVMKLQDIKDANQNLTELEGILSKSQERIEGALQETMEDLEKVTKQTKLIEEKLVELEDLEENLEKVTKQTKLIEEKLVELEDLEENLDIEKHLLARKKGRKRKHHADSDECSEVSKKTYKSPILGSPTGIDRESP